MTVNTTNITSGPYSGNDVADTFSYTFRIVDKSQVSVYETDDNGTQTLLTVDTDYTVAGIGDDDGGTITRVAGALPTGYEWFIRSNYQPTQLTAFESQGAFFPDLHENAMDKLTFLIQQLLDGENRSFRLSDTIDIDGTMTISQDATARAGLSLGFDDSGNLVTKQVFDSSVVVQEDFDKRHDVTMLTVAAMISATPVDAAGNAVTLNPGMFVRTQGRLAAGDRGAGVYLIMTAAAASAAGVNVDERGEAFTLDNGNIAVLQWQDRVLCTQFGIFPDEVTEWQDNGFNTTFLTFLRDNDVTGVFVAGFYKSKLDNFYSNVSVYCEPGAFWGGTVHAAINGNAADPVTGRPQNVVWRGQIGTYERVGTYNCDNVEIESILVKEDVAKNPSGLRGAGIHFYNSTKNLIVGSIIVEASERSYGLGIDTDNSNPPESIHIGSVHIKKSYTHGAAFICKNTRIDQLIIDDYAVGLLSDTNLTNTVPGSTVPLTDLHGFIVDGGEYPSFGEVIVRQSNAAADAGYGSWLNSSTLKIDRLVSRDAVGVGIGVLNTSVGIANIDELDVRSCSGEGVLNQGNMTLGKVTSTLNGGRGFQQSGGSLTAKQITCTSNNGEGFRAASAANLNVDSILGSLNNVTTANHQVFLDGVRGRIGVIQTARSATGEGGGIDFNGDLDGFNVGSIDCNNESKATGNIAAIIMNSVTGLHIDAMDLTADNAATAWQPLRMLTVTDVSINSMIIENQFNGFGIAGATYTRLGFMNSNNKTAVTNLLLASGAAVFNSANCAT